MDKDKVPQELLAGQSVELDVEDSDGANATEGKVGKQPHQKPEPHPTDVPEEDETPHQQSEAEPAEEDAEAERVAEAIKQAIEKQAREDENPHSTSFTLPQIIGGEMLQASVMRKNVWLIALIALFLVISVTNRYSVQKKLIEISKLEVRLNDAKYKALSMGSKYTEKTRLSYVLKALKNSKDSVLKIPDQPPYKIQVPEEEEQD